MPPKKTKSKLTKAEQVLLLVAARLDTALRYMEAKPDKDYSHYMDELFQEMVSRTYSLSYRYVYLMYSRDM